MATIHVADKLIERLQTQGVSNVDAFVEMLIRQMDDQEILAKSQKMRSETQLDVGYGKTITDLLSTFAQIREGLTQEELTDIVEAMNGGHR